MEQNQDNTADLQVKGMEIPPDTQESNIPVRIIQDSNDQPGIPLYFQFDNEEPVQFATVPISREVHFITLDTEELSKIKQDLRNPFFAYILMFSQDRPEGGQRMFKIFHVYNGFNETLLKKSDITVQS